MALNALIKFVQGASIGDGEALIINDSTVVNIGVSDNDLVQSWRIELLYGPPGSTAERAPGSPLTLAEQASDSTPSYNLTPDGGFAGCYRIRQTVYPEVDYGGVPSVDIRNLCVVTSNLYFVLPPYQELPEPLPLTGADSQPDELNFDAQPFGWIGDENAARKLLNKALETLDSSVFGGGGVDWQESVLSKDWNDPSGVPGPSTGDRYIIAAVAVGVWAGREDQIAEWNGSAWDYTDPDIGMTTFVEDIKKQYTYNGTAWVVTGSGSGLVGPTNPGDNFQLCFGNNGLQDYTDGIDVLNPGGAQDGLALSQIDVADSGHIDFLSSGNTVVSSGNIRLTNALWKIAGANETTGATAVDVLSHINGFITVGEQTSCEGISYRVKTNVNHRFYIGGSQVLDLGADTVTSLPAADGDVLTYDITNGQAVWARHPWTDITVPYAYYETGSIAFATTGDDLAYSRQVLASDTTITFRQAGNSDNGLRGKYLAGSPYNIINFYRVGSSNIRVDIGGTYPSDVSTNIDDLFLSCADDLSATAGGALALYVDEDITYNCGLGAVGGEAHIFQVNSVEVARLDVGSSSRLLFPEGDSAVIQLESITTPGLVTPLPLNILGQDANSSSPPIIGGVVGIKAGAGDAGGPGGPLNLSGGDGEGAGDDGPVVMMSGAAGEVARFDSVGGDPELVFPAGNSHIKFGTAEIQNLSAGNLVHDVATGKGHLLRINSQQVFWIGGTIDIGSSTDISSINYMASGTADAHEFMATGNVILALGTSTTLGHDTAVTTIDYRAAADTDTHQFYANTDLVAMFDNGAILLGGPTVDIVEVQYDNVAGNGFKIQNADLANYYMLWSTTSATVHMDEQNNFFFTRAIRVTAGPGGGWQFAAGNALGDAGAAKAGGNIFFSTGDGADGGNSGEIRFTIAGLNNCEYRLLYNIHEFYDDSGYDKVTIDSGGLKVLRSQISVPTQWLLLEYNKLSWVGTTDGQYDVPTGQVHKFQVNAQDVVQFDTTGNNRILVSSVGGPGTLEFASSDNNEIKATGTLIYTCGGGTEYQSFVVGTNERFRLDATGIGYFSVAAAPVVQQAGPTDITDNLTASATTTLEDSADYAGMSTDDNASTTTLTAQDTWYKFTHFERNDVSSGATPDYATDSDITINTAGKYLVIVSITFEASASNDYEWQVQEGDVDDSLPNLKTARDIAAGGDIGSVSISGIVDLSATDVLTLHARRTTGAAVSATVTGVNVTMSVTRVDNAVVDANVASVFNTADGLQTAFENYGLLS